MKKYYAVEFKSGPTTTTGQPHPRTGNYNKAVDLKVFLSQADCVQWLAQGKTTSDMQGLNRQAVTVKEARSMHLGMSVAEYNALLDELLQEARI